MSGRLEINVGGRIFCTTKGTLCFGGQGYFAAAFERWESDNLGAGSSNAVVSNNKRQRVDECGAGSDSRASPAEPDMMFIDRCPELFEHVLAWLRSGKIPSRCRADPLILQDLQEEGRFYALDGLVADCEEALSELTEMVPNPTARSFCEVVSEDARAIIKVKPGQVVFIQTAVLAGNCRTSRIADKKEEEEGEEEDEDLHRHEWAENRVYLRSGTKGADGDFQLLMAQSEDSYVYFPIVHRCLDDASVDDQHFMNLDLSHPVDLVVDHTVKLRGQGNGTWTVHGWAGDREAIPALASKQKPAGLLAPPPGGRNKARNHPGDANKPGGISFQRKAILYLTAALMIRGR